MRRHVIIKTGEGHIISRILGGLRTERSRGNCQGHAEWEQSDPDWSRVTSEWKRVDNKGGGTTLASARALCLD